MLGSAESEMVKLTSREIIFAEFEHDHDTSTFRHFCSIYGINDLKSRSEVIQGHRFW